MKRDLAILGGYVAALAATAALIQIAQTIT